VTAHVSRFLIWRTASPGFPSQNPLQKPTLSGELKPVQPRVERGPRDHVLKRAIQEWIGARVARMFVEQPTRSADGVFAPRGPAPIASRAKSGISSPGYPQ
jgi:hypothetical protein